MSDLKDLKDLLDRFGLGYEDRPRSVVEPGFPPPEDPTPWLRRLVIGTDGEKNLGYGGFVCEFYFDDDEQFVKVGVWE
jgi:hypothetical protein